MRHNKDENVNEGLSFTKTQFDLLDTLPIKGLAIKVKRSEGYQTNPSALIEVKDVYEDTFITIQDLINADFSLKSGEINAILPILEDKYLIDNLKSPLVQFIFSFVVTYNYDGQFKNAFAILLSRALVFAQKKQKQKLIDFLLEQTDIYFENNHTLLAEIAESIQDNAFSKYDIGILYLYLSY